MLEHPDKAQGKIFRNLIIDIILPVLILNKLAPYLGEHGAVKALIIAISLPLFHGLYDLVKEKKINYISLLGLINVGLTGGFALMKLEGMWFAIKEASFPAIIGIFVFFSGFTRKPLFMFFLEQPALFDTDAIQQKIDENQNTDNYEKLIKNCTFYFSGTFFLSALLNFVLAVRIFTDIPIDLGEAEQASMLNEQIADMTWMGYVVIALPLMVVTSTLFYYSLTQLSKLTQLPLNDLMKN